MIPTSRLRLRTHTDADPYDVADYAHNWGLIDASPGLFICTYATRPTTWDASQVGRCYLETDTGLIWRWTGAQAVRVHAKGDLGSADLTAQVQSSLTTLQTALTLNVTVPVGGRPVMVHVSGPGVYNTVGVTRLALFRGETQIQSWLVTGRLSENAMEQPGAIVMTVRDTPPAGAQVYSLRYSTEMGFGGTSTILAEISRPVRLSAVEV